MLGYVFFSSRTPFSHETLRNVWMRFYCGTIYTCTMKAFFPPNFSSPSNMWEKLLEKKDNRGSRDGWGTILKYHSSYRMHSRFLLCSLHRRASVIEHFKSNFIRWARCHVVAPFRLGSLTNEHVHPNVTASHSAAVNPGQDHKTTVLEITNILHHFFSILLILWITEAMAFSLCYLKAILFTCPVQYLLVARFVKNMRGPSGAQNKVFVSSFRCSHTDQ